MGGWNLQNWRHNNRGGFKLQDDPGFQFCLDEPQIIGSLREKSVFELNVSEKLKILVCMVNQMLSFAGVRDEIDTRNENVWETRVELRRCRADENKRIKEHETEEKRIAKGKEKVVGGKGEGGGGKEAKEEQCSGRQVEERGERCCNPERSGSSSKVSRKEARKS